MVHLRQTLEHIHQVEEPSQVYSYIMQSSRLPDSLREWTAINLDDKGQLQEIWRYVRHSIDVIDYFLNSFVFPRHAKQFEVKLQAVCLILSSKLCRVFLCLFHCYLVVLDAC